MWRCVQLACMVCFYTAILRPLKGLTGLFLCFPLMHTSRISRLKLCTAQHGCKWFAYSVSLSPLVPSQVLMLCVASVTDVCYAVIKVWLSLLNSLIPELFLCRQVLLCNKRVQLVNWDTELTLRMFIKPRIQPCTVQIDCFLAALWQLLWGLILNLW